MKAKTKKKLIIWLSVIAAVIIIGFIGFRLALNFAGDKAMQLLMENQINSMLDSGEITLDDLEAIIESEPEEEAEQTPAEQASAEADNPSPAEQKQPEQKPASTQTSAPQKKPAEQKPVEQKPAERQETVKKASDKLAFGITRADKDEMMKLITKRLSGSDISYLAGLLAGGLTREERSAAAKIAYSRFSGAELDAVSRFYHKYKKAIMIEPDYGVEE